MYKRPVIINIADSTNYTHFYIQWEKETFLRHTQFSLQRRRFALKVFLSSFISSWEQRQRKGSSTQRYALHPSSSPSHHHQTKNPLLLLSTTKISSSLWLMWCFPSSIMFLLNSANIIISLTMNLTTINRRCPRKLMLCPSINNNINTIKKWSLTSIGTNFSRKKSTISTWFELNITRLITITGWSLNRSPPLPSADNEAASALQHLRKSVS